MNYQKDSGRNSGFDFLKYICAFMVICIHLSYRGQTTLEPLTRVAVPVFFMISGYYYTSLKQKGRILHQIKRLLILILCTNIGFILFDALLLLLKGLPLSGAVSPWCNADTWITFFLFNLPPIWAHVWYLSALLYVYLLVYLFEKIGPRRILYFFIPVLLCANLIMGTYLPLLFRAAVPLKWSRNFLFIGLPCFLLGDLIRQKEDRIKIGNLSLILLGIISCITSVLENKFLSSAGLCINKDFFLSTIFVALSLFLLAMNYPHAERTLKIVHKIAYMGKEYSLLIYIFHPPIILIVSEIVAMTSPVFPGINTLFFYTGPFLILLLSTLAAASIRLLTKRINFNQHKKD